MATRPPGGAGRSDQVLAGLEARFQRVLVEAGPYIFPDLPDTEVDVEQATIDAGH